MDWKGFTELKLEKAEMVNHNVKKLTFALPDDQSITGIAPVSMFFHHSHHWPENLADMLHSLSFDSPYSRRCFYPGFQTVHPGQRQQ